MLFRSDQVALQYRKAEQVVAELRKKAKEDKQVNTDHFNERARLRKEIAELRAAAEAAPSAATTTAAEASEVLALKATVQLLQEEHEEAVDIASNSEMARLKLKEASSTSALHSSPLEPGAAWPREAALHPGLQAQAWRPRLCKLRRQRRFRAARRI